jgi:hypothetical protein
MLPLQDIPGSKDIISEVDKTPKEQKGPETSHATTSKSIASVGRLVGNATKGVLVDIPLALTEGLRAVPQHYGAPTQKHGAVEDLRSGMSVAGTTFCTDMAGGLTDIFTHTYDGKKEKGASGAAKGLCKGAFSFVTKTTSATLGLVAFPAQGLYRSIWSSTHKTTRDVITECKLIEGDWLLSADTRWQLDPENIGYDLDGLRGIR